MDEDENLCKLKKMTKQKKIKNVETLKIKELSRSNNITAVEKIAILLEIERLEEMIF